VLSVCFVRTAAYVTASCTGLIPMLAGGTPLLVGGGIVLTHTWLDQVSAISLAGGTSAEPYRLMQSALYVLSRAHWSRDRQNCHHGCLLAGFVGVAGATCTGDG
jgi:hypothetical protein